MRWTIRGLALAALGGALLGTPPGGAQGLLGLGDEAAPAREQAFTRDDRVWDRWVFQPNPGNRPARVEHYSPNLDGLGFGNVGSDGKGACYGHTLLSMRWFQYIVKPLKTGVLASISQEEFRDFWGGKMRYPPAYPITPANVDSERLQPYSVFDEAARVAIGRLVGLYQDYQSNLFDHGSEHYTRPEVFRLEVIRLLATRQLPIQIKISRPGGAHSLLAYQSDWGTAMVGKTEDAPGERRRAYRIRVYDPNVPGQGAAGSDEEYGRRFHLMVARGGHDFVGMSEAFEGMYGPRYLFQVPGQPAGTWQLPPDRYGLEETWDSDGGEVRSWFPGRVGDAAARVISGLDPPPSVD